MFKKAKFLSAALVVMLVISCFAVTPFADDSATASIWGSDFEDGKNTIISSSVDKAAGKVVSNPDTVVGGYVYEGKVTSDGGIVNADTIGMTVSSDGVWIFETDVYLPNDFPSDYQLNIFPYAATDSSAPDILRLGSESSRKSTALPNFPRDKWVTLRWVFDFESVSSTCATQVWLIDGNVETLVRQANIDKYATAGISKIRFQIHTVPNNTRFYLDNLKCWQESETLNIRSLSNKAEVHFKENFEDVRYEFTAASTNFGTLGITGFANTTNGAVKTVSDPSSSGKGNVLYYKSGNDGDTDKRLQLCTNGSFPIAITGTQIIDISLYVPTQTTTQTLEDIVLSYKNSSSQNGVQVRLGLADGYAGTVSSAPIGGVTMAPINKWFTVRVILNYNNDIAEIQLIEDGVITLLNSKALTERLIGKGLNSIEISRSEKENTEFYIGEISYYESDNMPSVIDFDRFSSISAVKDFIVNTGGVAKYSLGDDPEASSHRKVLKLYQEAIEADANTASQNVVNFDTRLDPVGFNDGITTLSADFYIPEVLSDGVSLSIAPFTDDRVISSTEGATTKVTTYGTPVGKSFKLQGDSVYIGGNDTGFEYPVGEWFTAYSSYNIKNATYSHYIKKEDGTVIVIGDFLNDISSTAVTQIAKNGIKRARVQFSTPAGVAHDAIEFYIDNIKFSNAVWGDISLADNGTYTASVEYSAQGEVVTNTKLMLAQYNTAGELVAVNIYTPTFADGTGVYTVDNIAKASSATRAKLIYWDSLGGVTPLAVAAE